MQRRSLLRLGKYLAPYKGMIAVLFAGLVLESLYETTARFSAKIIVDQAVGPRDVGVLVAAVGALVVGGGLYVGLCVLTDYIWARCGLLVINDLRVDLFRRVQAQSLDWLSRSPSGDLAARFNADAQRIEDGVLYAGPMALIGAFDLCACLVLMHGMSAPLLAVGAGCLGLSLLLPRLINRRAAAANLTFRNAEGALSGHVVENLQAQTMIKAFGLERRAVEDFRARARRVADLGLASYFLGFLLQRIPTLVFLLGSLVILGFGAWLTIIKAITLGDLVAFQLLYLGLGQALSSVTWLLPSLVDAASSFERIREVLDAPVRIADRPDARALAPVARDIVFERVSFAPEGRSPSLRGVDLRIARGEYVAIVGPSGSGKTTLANLLMRFVEASEGRVLVDGVDVREVTLESLRRRVGVVSQDVVVTDAPLIDNIRFGRLDATDAEVEQAARAARLGDLIARLPRGLATRPGEGGRLLSGGERQRLAIARALLRRPDILILDEPTAALDAGTEAAILDAFEPLRGNTTLIAITHRLGLARRADRIVLMNEGRILEQGGHAELMARRGAYARLFEHEVGRAVA